MTHLFGLPVSTFLFKDSILYPLMVIFGFLLIGSLDELCLANNEEYVHNGI